MVEAMWHMCLHDRKLNSVTTTSAPYILAPGKSVAIETLKIIMPI